MIQLAYNNPHWFYGKDLVIDIISAFVPLLIAFFSLRYYKIEKKNKNYLYLAISFLLIALSFFFKILTNFSIEYNLLEVRNFGFMTVVHNYVKTSDILFVVGYLIYRALNLLGLYTLYSIYQEQPKSNIFLIVFLIAISTYFSQSSYYMFHLTALILLSLITLQYYHNYKKNRQFSAKMLTTSFAIIGASQIFFMFVHLNQVIYVAAEIIQLMGYLLLLTAFVKVLRNAKKKK